VRQRAAAGREHPQWPGTSGHLDGDQLSAEDLRRCHLVHHGDSAAKPVGDEDRLVVLDEDGGQPPARQQRD
jgi:hypothetical protein